MAPSIERYRRILGLGLNVIALSRSALIAKMTTTSADACSDPAVSYTSPATVRLYDQAAHLEATFVPRAGMLCAFARSATAARSCSTRAGIAAYAERGTTMGIPLLYPWANRLAGFQYRVAGTEVRVPRDETLVALDGNGLPIHGVLGGRLAWRPEPVADGGDSLAATLRWDRSQPELFAVFPFRHDVHHAARLTGGCLTVTVTVEASAMTRCRWRSAFTPTCCCRVSPASSC